MELTNIKSNKKSEFTRRCIGEAVVILLQKVEFTKLKVSEIVRKAGVSRSSFYQYYDSPYTVLKDYLQIIVMEYIVSSENQGDDNKFFNFEHIVFSFNFFDRYRDYFLTLTKNKLHAILFEGINDFVVNHISSSYKLSVYERYCYAGALLNSFLMWEENGRKDSAEQVAHALVGRPLIGKEVIIFGE